MTQPSLDNLERAIQEAARHLQAGGVVAFPTDTLYGLGAVARDELAVRRLYRIKGRELDKSLPILVASEADVDELAPEVPESAQRLMEVFWPGALTIVLRRRPSFHSPAVVGDTVAVRIPDHPVARRLIELVGEPITGTSANRSGGPSPVTADDVRVQLGDAVDFILDAGPCPGGTESTVIDCTTEMPRILRAGAISAAKIAAVLNREIRTE
jgi:L-threonylcarbamoyladenylate synthase